MLVADLVTYPIIKCVTPNRELEYLWIKMIIYPGNSLGSQNYLEKFPREKYRFLQIPEWELS